MLTKLNSILGLNNARAILMVASLLGLSAVASARPISYSGGTTLISEVESTKESILFHYSPTYMYSVGIEAVNDKIDNDDYAYLKVTYLANRKNTRYTQRNLYFHYALSTEGLDNYYYGLNGDMESRRLFGAFGLHKIEKTRADSYEGFLQVGIAPYIGNYGDTHTWLMVRSVRREGTKDWDTFPIVRVFKGNALIDLGYSETSDWNVNFIYRF